MLYRMSLFEIREIRELCPECQSKSHFVHGEVALPYEFGHGESYRSIKQWFFLGPIGEVISPMDQIV